MVSRVLFVADSDSHVAFAAAFGAHLKLGGIDSEIVLVARKAAALAQAAAALGGPRADIQIVCDVSSLFRDRALLAYDAIFVLISGKNIQAFCIDLTLMADASGAAKPITIGGFIGEWISGEAQVQERGALDFFIVNREDELDLFRKICARRGHDGELLALAYAFVVRHDFGAPLSAACFDYDLATPILFADQVQVPRSDEERRQLYEGLEALAKASPKRTILFCTREAPGGVTSHPSRGDIADYLSPERLSRIPNLVVERGAFRRRLREAKLVVSVSSTAGVEALVNGVPALFLRGFSNSGAEKFDRSGLLIDLADLNQARTYTIAADFYDAVTQKGVWRSFAELLRELPAMAERATSPDRPASGPAIGVFEPFSKFGQRLRRTPGVSGIEIVPASSPRRPLHLAAALAMIEGAPPDYVASLRVSDAPRTTYDAGSPTVVTMVANAYAARAEFALASQDATVHLPTSLADGDEIVVAACEAQIVLRKVAGRVDIDAPEGVAVSFAEYLTESMRLVTTIRLQSAAPRVFGPVVMSRSLGLLTPRWIAYGPSETSGRLGALSPSLTSEPVRIPEHKGQGQIVMLALELDDPKREGALLALEDDLGSRLDIYTRQDGELSARLVENGRLHQADGLSSAAAMTISIVSASSRTIMIANERRHTFDVSFRPTEFRLGATAGGLTLRALSVLGGAFSDDAASEVARNFALASDEGPVATSFSGASIDTARIFGRYFDLIGSSHLTSAIAAMNGSRPPLAQAKTYLGDGAAAEAFAISAICVDRTPTSVRHLLICAEALAALGASDRAEPFLRAAARLAPNDLRVKAAAAIVRGRTPGQRASPQHFVGALVRTWRAMGARLFAGGRKTSGRALTLGKASDGSDGL